MRQIKFRFENYQDVKMMKTRIRIEASSCAAMNPNLQLTDGKNYYEMLYNVICKSKQMLGLYLKKQYD